MAVLKPGKGGTEKSRSMRMKRGDDPHIRGLWQQKPRENTHNHRVKEERKKVKKGPANIKYTMYLKEGCQQWGGRDSVEGKLKLGGKTCENVVGASNA